MDCIDKLGASIDDLKASQNKLVELYVATVAERDRLREVNRELLEALKDAIQIMERKQALPEHIERTQRVIAKAQGQE